MKTLHRTSLVFGAAAILLLGVPAMETEVSAKEPLKEGDAVPAMSFGADDGRTISTADARGGWLILYFYPKDDTPGCTAQAKAFSELLPAYSAVGATVYGINTDGAESHRKFKWKHDLRVTLLTDPTGEAAALFGIRVVLGLCARDSVLINPAGTIERIYRGVDPKGNPREILEYIQKRTPPRPPGK